MDRTSRYTVEPAGVSATRREVRSPGRTSSWSNNNIFWTKDHTQRMIELYRRRFAHYGHGTEQQAIVGLGGQVFMRRNSQDAVKEFRPYFDNAPVYGHGP